MPKYNPTTSGNPYVTAFHDLMATSKDFAKFLSDSAERQGIRQGFTDAVNRGAVAATLGAPVDMANTALNLGKAAVGYFGNKAGVLSADQMPQLIDNPVGGSEYIGNQMRRLGVVSPNRNALAESIAGFLPMSPSTSGKAVAAIAGGGMVPGLDLAATVFHGSPHKFDRFDSSKIGTGEGAQAYGHGLYLAESPEVANTYKLAGVDAVNLVGRDGGAINLSALPQPLQKALNANAGAPDLLGNAQRFLANKFNQDYYSEKYGASSIDDAVKALQDLRASGVSVENPGSLYKVDLPDEAIAKMLDYDKPLNEQAPEVLDAMRKVAGSGRYMNLGGTRQFIEPPPAWMTGGAAYARVGRLLDRGDAAASDALRQAGIPGIRYLDAGSRGSFKVQNTYKGKPYGDPVSFATELQAKQYASEQIAKGFGADLQQGTSNYVVFPGEENMLRILERNGQALK